MYVTLPIMRPPPPIYGDCEAVASCWAIILLVFWSFNVSFILFINSSSGYLNFLALITPIIHQYQPIIIEHLKAQEELTATTTEQNIQLATTTEVSESQSPGENIPASTPIVRDTTSDNNGQQNDDSNSNGCVVS